MLWSWIRRTLRPAMRCSTTAGRAPSIAGGGLDKARDPGDRESRNATTCGARWPWSRSAVADHKFAEAFAALDEIRASIPIHRSRTSISAGRQHVRSAA